MTGAFTGGPPATGSSFYGGRYPFGERGGVVDGHDDAGESFIRALFEDHIIWYGGHSYHPPEDPDDGPFSNIYLKLGAGESVLDISPEVILSEPDTGDGMGQATLVVLQTCFGFQKPTGQDRSIGGACVDRGAQAVIGYGFSVWCSTIAVVDARIWQKMAVEQKTATQAVEQTRAELESEMGQDEYIASGVDGLMARPVGTQSTISPAPLACPPPRHRAGQG